MPADFGAWYVVFAALAGLLTGSFLNVCIYRVPRDVSVIAPRSFCPECGAGIAWYDNIPLLSYAALRGRCRHCHQTIGFRYVLVEIATAVLFAITAWRYGWSVATLKWLIFESILVVLFWTDLEERILPDEFTLGGIGLGILASIFVGVPGVFGDLWFGSAHLVLKSVCNAAIGAVFLALPLWVIGAVYARIRHRDGLGLGDIKLVALIGIFLGVENGLWAFMFGAIAGSVIGVLFIWLAKKRAATYELPFGSFLCLGAATLPLWHVMAP